MVNRLPRGPAWISVRAGEAHQGRRGGGRARPPEEEALRAVEPGPELRRDAEAVAPELLQPEVDHRVNERIDLEVDEPEEPSRVVDARQQRRQLGIGLEEVGLDAPREPLHAQLLADPREDLGAEVPGYPGPGALRVGHREPGAVEDPLGRDALTLREQQRALERDSEYACPRVHGAPKSTTGQRRAHWTADQGRRAASLSGSATEEQLDDGVGDGHPGLELDVEIDR